jgi:hypothetical protein
MAGVPLREVYYFRAQWCAHARMACEEGVDDAIVASAVEGLSRQGVVELASLCGYYTLASFALNTFAVPLPPGVTSRAALSDDLHRYS